MLGQWISYVVAKQVYALEAICEDICVDLGLLYGFIGQQDGMEFGYENVWESQESFLYLDVVV